MKTTHTEPILLSHTSPASLAVIALSLATMLILPACGKKDEAASDKTVGQKLDAAITKTEIAATEAKAKAEASMAKAGESLKSDAQKAETSGQKTVESVAATLDDAAITASISAELAKDADLSAIKIDVDTKNGKVTLYGPAPTAQARDKATTLAKSIKGVNTVDNKLVVKAN